MEQKANSIGEEMIKVENSNESIIVKFPYNPDYIAKIKTIKGYRWHPEEKHWSIPHSELEKFLSVFDEEKLESDLLVWFNNTGKGTRNKKIRQKNDKVAHSLQQRVSGIY